MKQWEQRGGYFSRDCAEPNPEEWYLIIQRMPHDPPAWWALRTRRDLDRAPDCLGPFSDCDAAIAAADVYWD